MSTKPPDKTRPGDDSLGRFANNAEHSSQYRVYLRPRLHYLPYLNNAALANVLEKTCRIDPSSLARSAQEESVRAYANESHLRLIDEDWQNRLNQAQSAQEKETILREPTTAAPFQNVEALKRKILAEWSDSTHELLSAPPANNQRPTLRPATPPPVTKADLPMEGLPKILHQISGELEKDSTLKTRITGLLQNLLSGIQPPKKQLQELMTEVSSSKCSLHGLKLGLDLSVESMRSHEPSYAQDPRLPQTQQNTRRSYASIARTSFPIADNPPRRSSARRELVALRHAIRDDARSVKLRSVKADGARPPGMIASAIAKLIDANLHTSKVVEDVRSDSRGTTYIQLHAEDFETRLQQLMRKANSDQVIDLGDIGLYVVSEPTKCPVAGMIPIVLSGVKLSHSPAQIASEIWEMNATRWGLGNEQCAQHIAGISRLNRRVRPQEGEEKPTTPIWVQSKSVKMFISKELLRVMSNSEEDRYVIRYEYEFLEGRPFRKPLRLCENCGVLAEHDARACRRPAHCHICNGNHRSADCKKNNSVHPPMSSKSAQFAAENLARFSLLNSNLTSRKDREAQLQDTTPAYGKPDIDDMCIDYKHHDK